MKTGLRRRGADRIGSQGEGRKRARRRETTRGGWAARLSPKMDLCLGLTTRYSSEMCQPFRSPQLRFDFYLFPVMWRSAPRSPSLIPVVGLHRT
jgi:hypothetical protein